MTDPDIDELYRRGNELRSNGRFEPAEALLREVLQREPSRRHAAYSLAFMLREHGRIEAAADVVIAAWENAAQTAQETLAAIAFLTESGAQARTRIIANEACRRWPDDARIAARAGEIALALGYFDEAAAALRSGLEGNPNLSAAWLRLAYCQRFSDRADADVQRFGRAWQDPALDPTARLCAGFAFGKALDDIGDYATAAQVLSQANAAARSRIEWHNETWRNLLTVRRIVATTTRVSPRSDFVPVFIVGLPRTGTTLIARALGRLPLVRDRGELNWIPAMHDHLQAQHQSGEPPALAAVARLVEDQMRRDDAPARFYIDKNPLNFRYLDFVATLFPDAKIVHCRRNARDTALSLWMQHFAHDDLAFSYDFSAIAEVQEIHRMLMARWQVTPRLDTIDVDYEDFVADPAGQTQRLASFLGIDAQTSSEVETDSVVTTASVWQARQPVYRHAVQRWRHYAPYLPELTQTFGE